MASTGEDRTEAKSAGQSRAVSSRVLSQRSWGEKAFPRETEMVGWGGRRPGSWLVGWGTESCTCCSALTLPCKGTTLGQQPISLGLISFISCLYKVGIMPLGRIYILLGYVGPSGVEGAPLCVCVCACTRAHVCSVTQLCLTLCDPMNCSPPGSSVHGFSKQEFWSGLPCPIYIYMYICIYIYNVLRYYIYVYIYVSSFRIWNSSTGIPSHPLALFMVMLSKGHLTSHSKMSGSRVSDHTIVIILVVKIFFVQFFCVFLPPLLNIFSFC